MYKVINPVEYKMTEAFAKNLLKSRKGTDAKLTPKEYLCNYVNEQCGVRGTSVKEILY